jgi:hypothetical protein
MESPADPAVITLERAVALFTELAARKDIAFRFLRDGCYARAHLMAFHLKRSGVEPRKVWTFASNFMHDPLWVNVPGESGGRIVWKYHVALVISARLPDGEVRDLVLDPSIFDHPVTVDEWSQAQHDTPEVRYTAPGEPPFPERGGSGYWPAPDPLEGPDEHARSIMIDYGAESDS